MSRYWREDGTGGSGISRALSGWIPRIIGACWAPVVALEDSQGPNGLGAFCLGAVHRVLSEGKTGNCPRDLKKGSEQDHNLAVLDVMFLIL